MRDGVRLLTGRLLLAAAATAASVAPVRADEAMDGRIEALVPALEAYIEAGMQAFDDPGLAIGIVSGDRLVYGKGFGVGREGGPPVDTDTVFQIGSTTKAFLATTMAIAVDRELLAWDDRVVDRDPDFRLMDNWASQEFRIFDLLAQRSGLPSYANDFVGILGGDETAMIRSLRFVEPVSSFRSSFAYTNITHIVAGRIVARQFGAPDWSAVAQTEILDRLGMTRSSLTAEAIEAAENATVGHRFDPAGAVEVPFSPLFPYAFEGAGAINSSVEDLVPWIRLHLGNGTLDGTEIVSAANLAVTKTARVGITDKLAYAMGWVLQSTPNGQITWHNGGTMSYGAYIGTLLDKDVGIVVLTNLTNVGFPDAVGEWALDRLLGNPEIDHVAARLAAATEAFAKAAPPPAPADAAPPPPLAGLAGDYASGKLGAGTLAVDGDGLVLTLASGARLRLSPWDGDVFAVSLIPEGRLAAIAANMGEAELALAQFIVDPQGERTSFRLTMLEDGQEVVFRRE